MGKYLLDLNEIMSWGMEDEYEVMVVAISVLEVLVFLFDLTVGSMLDVFNLPSLGLLKEASLLLLNVFPVLQSQIL